MNNMMKGIGQVVLNRKKSTNLLQYSCKSSNKFPFPASKSIKIKGLLFSPSSPSLMDDSLLYRCLVDRIG